MAFPTDDMRRGTRTPDSVAAKLEQLILDGVFRPGQLLPSERRLCDKLGVSRASLREGLRILRSKGIIATRHGHGSTVAHLLPAQDQSPLMHLFKSHPRTLFDLLEGESARLAASRGTPADRVLITRRYQEMADYVEGADAIDVECLARLHRAVVQGKPELARRVALEHLSSIGDNLREIEAESERLKRSAMRLEGWE